MPVVFLALNPKVQSGYEYKYIRLSARGHAHNTYSPHPGKWLSARGTWTTVEHPRVISII